MRRDAGIVVAAAAGIVVAAAAALGGCGSSQSESSAPAGGEPATGGESALALPGLGRIVVHCATGGGVAARFDPSGASATERIAAEGERRHHLVSATVSPGDAP